MLLLGMGGGGNMACYTTTCGYNQTRLFTTPACSLAGWDWGLRRNSAASVDSCWSWKEEGVVSVSAGGYQQCRREEKPYICSHAKCSSNSRSQSKSAAVRSAKGYWLIYLYEHIFTVVQLSLSRQNIILVFSSAICLPSTLNIRPCIVHDK